MQRESKLPAADVPVTKAEKKPKESNDKDSPSDEISKSWCLAAEYA